MLTGLFLLLTMQIFMTVFYFKVFFLNVSDYDYYSKLINDLFSKLHNLSASPINKVVSGNTYAEGR